MKRQTSVEKVRELQILRCFNGQILLLVLIVVIYAKVWFRGGKSSILSLTDRFEIRLLVKQKGLWWFNKYLAETLFRYGKEVGSSSPPRLLEDEYCESMRCAGFDQWSYTVIPGKFQTISYFLWIYPKASKSRYSWKRRRHGSRTSGPIG